MVVVSIQFLEKKKIVEGMIGAARAAETIVHINNGGAGGTIINN